MEISIFYEPVNNSLAFGLNRYIMRLFNSAPGISESEGRFLSVGIILHF